MGVGGVGSGGGLGAGGVGGVGRPYEWTYVRIRMFVSRLPYHLIDAGKKKPASIKWEIDQGCTYHLIDAGKKKPASIKWEIDQGCTYVRLAGL